jgi:RND family efflux transporter MFP subunit
MERARDRLGELRIEREGSDRPSRARIRLWLGAALGLGVLGGLALWWALAGRAAAVVTATVREVSGAAPTEVLRASGYVTARRKATVSSKLTGKLVEVRVEEGMPVREGQVLARLDDALLRPAVAVAQAELAFARQAALETEAAVRLARLALARARRLAESGVIGQAELDRAQADSDALEARLAAARERVAVAEKTVALRSAELADTAIRAPFSGIVVSKDAQPGEMVSPVSAGGGFTRTGICTIVDMDSLEIEVDVNESSIQRVEPGQKVEAVLDAYPDWRIPGRVLALVPAADRQKATVRVRIALEERDPRILPDMGVKVAFLGRESARSSSRLVVPAAAVRKEGNQEVVFVVREGRVERRAVRTAPASGKEVEVLAGLGVGEVVVVEGPAGLADGDRVAAR